MEYLVQFPGADSSFLLFPSSFIISADALALAPPQILILALIVVGFAMGLSLIIVLVGHATLFRLESVFTPHAISAFLGLVNIGWNLLSHQGRDSTTSVSRVIVSIAVAGVCLSTYGIAALVTFRRVKIIRSRCPIPSSPLTKTLDEDELQRQQLINLLQSADAASSSAKAVTSPATYKIQWPNRNSGSPRDTRQRPRAIATTAARPCTPTSIYSPRAVPAAQKLTVHRSRAASVPIHGSRTESAIVGMPGRSPVEAVSPSLYKASVGKMAQAQTVDTRSRKFLPIDSGLCTILPGLDGNGYPTDKPRVTRAASCTGGTSSAPWTVRDNRASRRPYCPPLRIPTS